MKELLKKYLKSNEYVGVYASHRDSNVTEIVIHIFE